MLLKDFYKVTEIKKISDGEHVALIRLNKDHDIFKGHFPGNPVTPGVCMVQILKELVSTIIGTKITMKSSNNIKFMALINPDETPDLKLEISIQQNENEISVKNSSFFNDTLALKMGAKYEVI